MTAMTRKDFEFIAKTLESVVRVTSQVSPGHVNSKVRAEMLRVVLETFADRLELTNPLFNRQRFLTAAGYLSEFLQAN